METFSVKQTSHNQFVFYRLTPDIERYINLFTKSEFIELEEHLCSISKAVF